MAFLRTDVENIAAVTGSRRGCCRVASSRTDDAGLERASAISGRAVAIMGGVEWRG